MKARRNQESFGKTAAAALSGFGIYLGRFLRFNSWDVLLRPGKLLGSLNDWVANPLANSHTFAFPLLFAVFLFVAYVMLYALTHLPRDFHAFSKHDSVDR